MTRGKSEQNSEEEANNEEEEEEEEVLAEEMGDDVNDEVTNQSEDEDEDKVKQKLDELCSGLNMDEETATEAWNSFVRIRTNYTLEGEELQWLACALYVACRKSRTLTMAHNTMEGNCVSLTRILRLSHLSLIDFFDKMRKWSEMAAVPLDFQNRINCLERNFTVSTVIFQKLKPIFLSVFHNPHYQPPRQPRSRKRRCQPCTAEEVFKFCWTLFLRAKANFPMISDDIVNSYHLLLCCLDLTYGNALLSQHWQCLLNPAFPGLPDGFGTRDFRPPNKPPCIIGILCNLHDGLVIEAKGIKEHYWKPFISRLFERKVLKGQGDTLTGLLDDAKFAENYKAINKEYEEYVLTVGDFDERVFLGEEPNVEIGTPHRRPCLERHLSECMQRHIEKNNSLTPLTPLTGRRYLKEKDLSISPVSMATQSVGLLHELLVGFRNSPSAQLLQMLRECSPDPTETMLILIKEVGEKFCCHYCHPSEEARPGTQAEDFANRRLRLSEALYYKLLEGVIQQECRIAQERRSAKPAEVADNKTSPTPSSALLTHDDFHRSLLACCLEIVLFSYNSQCIFPWVLSVLNLSAYSFYRVLEIVVRTEKGLPRDVVKHLNHVEEQVLERLAWCHDSPLWVALQRDTGNIPCCKEVLLPGHLEVFGANLEAEPMEHPRVREVRTNACNPTKQDGLLSPISLHERYSSPSAGTARRKLFIDSSDSQSTSEIPVQPTTVSASVAPCGISTSTVVGNATMNTCKPAQTQLIGVVPSQNLMPSHTVLTMATATMTATNGQSVTIPVQGIASEKGTITFVPLAMNIAGQLQPTLQILSSTENHGTTETESSVTQGEVQVAQQQLDSKPRRTGSLALFFRKVYHLASVRLLDLCNKLDVLQELRAKVWTCFEHVLVHCTDLMMDRHLDQLLMCCIYVMAKVTNEERTFQQIMRWYRSQPQAQSHVYRSVLFKNCSSSGSSASSFFPAKADMSKLPKQQTSPADSMRLQDEVKRETMDEVVHGEKEKERDEKAKEDQTTKANRETSNEELQEQRGDLIQFYNQIFVDRIRTFALQFSITRRDITAEVLPLSPFPSMKLQPSSQRRISQNLPVYVSPHKRSVSLEPPHKSISYRFNQSPSRRLREINMMIQQSQQSAGLKRCLPLDEVCNSPAKHARLNDSLLIRRLQVVAKERGITEIPTTTSFCSNPPKNT
uniref:retinoblastoma-like protein 1 isoform X2 n=1 Tax=Myxine glutinosa TaxID=7769 RepID=UPI00358FB10D